ncbi:hypothetical protein PR001_g7542 [Phytophthora rubi]|uniref:SWIM-type domain-containing protein n=1 Tax=Phytophthora rubi TaxID=129364 RepID=A0A6A3NG66_9STRA|nr:hypothetical protein PR001_g7542 [Phytophthora rubi]
MVVSSHLMWCVTPPIFFGLPFSRQLARPKHNEALKEARPAYSFRGNEAKHDDGEDGASSDASCDREASEDRASSDASCDSEASEARASSDASCDSQVAASQIPGSAHGGRGDGFTATIALGQVYASGDLPAPVAHTTEAYAFEEAHSPPPNRAATATTSWNFKSGLDTVKSFSSFDEDNTFRKKMECNFVISGHSRTKNGDSKTYRCKSHTDCPASVRIRQFALEFICQRSGDHADGTVEVQLIREIHKCFLKDLDLMFVSGQTPLSALDQLCRRYGDDDDKKKLLPDISQVRNRKAGWKTEQIKGKWKQLSSHDELFEWAASGLCKNKDNFDSVDEREVLVLDVFRSKDVSDTNESSFGMVLSCKRLLQNFGIAAADGDPVSISCDGTYRLTNAVRLDKLEALPNVTNDMIQLFRRKYSCECKAYVQSGWVCSHVLAAASINEHLNLKEVQAGIPHRRLPGRPRKELSCLIRDTLEASEAEDAVFKGPAARLKRHLKKYPTEAIGYKALHRFTTSLPETRGQFQTSCFDGFVSSVQAADDPVTWTISFTDGQTHDVLLDEIVTDLTLATTRQI